MKKWQAPNEEHAIMSLITICLGQNDNCATALRNAIPRWFT